jgi:hypothetical protein
MEIWSLIGALIVGFLVTNHGISQTHKMLLEILSLLREQRGEMRR